MEAEGGNKRRPWARRAQSALRMGVLCCALAQLPRARSGCWKPAKFIEHMCKDAESNVLPIYEAPDSSRRRHLLWHGGGPEYKDIPDHDLGEGQLYRGDGGTLHPYELTGKKINEPGSPDFLMIHAYDIESRFFDFCEGRADRGLSDLFGREDSWWADLLRCHNETGDATLRMCQKCGTSCLSYTWETSGYSLLNGTELEIPDLTWMTHNVYITKEIILPLSVCAQFDWWICIRRLEESTKSQAMSEEGVSHDEGGASSGY